MICTFYELYPKIFHGRNLPYRIPTSGKDPRKLFLFKCFLQALKELKDKNGPDPRIWIIAQLKTLRAIDTETDVFLSGNSFYGEKAWNRWKVFEAHAKKQANRVVQTASLKIKKIIESMEQTHKLIGSDLEKMFLSGKIRNLARDNKISRVYLCLHPEIIEFAKKYTWKAVGTDPIEIAGLDNKEILEAFEKITGKSPSGPKIHV